MKNAAEILHDVKMQIVEMQMQAQGANFRLHIAALKAETQEEKEIHQSHASAQIDIFLLLEKLLTTAKGE